MEAAVVRTKKRVADHGEVLTGQREVNAFASKRSTPRCGSYGLLKLLGREHNAKQGEESFDIFRDAGFSNINVDLMFGLPGQTIQQWRSTLEQTVSLMPEHISTYCLT